MTIDQIEYFLELDKYKNFSIAADELCISQSSLSKQIKSLENELNLILFKRNKRNIKLSPAGEDFKVSAEKIMNEYKILMQNMKSHISEKTILSFATIPVVNQYGVANLVAEFINKYPTIKLNLEEMVHNKIVEELKNGKIDIAFMREENLSSEEFNITPLFEDELVLLVSKNHPLSKKKYTSLSELQNENFILLDEQSGVYQTCIDSCKKAGFTPNVLYSNSRIETIIGLVGAEVGISLLMGETIKCFNKYNVTTILLNEKITSKLGLVTYKKNKVSQNCKTFENFISERVK